MIYVASSWKNPIQIGVVAACQSAGLDVYDFRNPVGKDTGFHWSEVLPTWRSDWPVGLGEQTVPVEEYLEGVQSFRADEGFSHDFNAMQKCDTCVLVLPCGRSAHLELGWFVGQGKKTAILLEQEFMVPELMYKMVDYLSPSLFDLLGWLGVED